MVKEKTTYLQKLGVQEMKRRSGCPGAVWQLLLGKEGRPEVEWEMRGKVPRRKCWPKKSGSRGVNRTRKNEGEVKKSGASSKQKTQVVFAIGTSGNVQ